MSIFHDYNNASCFYDDQRTAIGSDVIAAMIQLYTNKQLKDLHVLDAGCGTGSYAKALLDIGVGQLTLLDASAGMLEKAKAKLKIYLDQGKVRDFVECRMPSISLPDGCFDAVMFNTVLHHLDRANSNLENCIQTLRESRRVLRPNGVIVVTTILPEIFAGSLWFMQIENQLTKRFLENMVLSMDQLYRIFDAAGIACTQKLNILGSDLLKFYYNVEDPLEESLKRILNEYWSFGTENETGKLVQTVKEIKERGGLDAWIKSHDHTNTTGLLTVMICKPI